MTPRVTADVLAKPALGFLVGVCVNLLYTIAWRNYDFGLIDPTWTRINWLRTDFFLLATARFLIAPSAIYAVGVELQQQWSGTWKLPGTWRSALMGSVSARFYLETGPISLPLGWSYYLVAPLLFGIITAWISPRPPNQWNALVEAQQPSNRSAAAKSFALWTAAIGLSLGVSSLALPVGACGVVELLIVLLVPVAAFRIGLHASWPAAFLVFGGLVALLVFVAHDLSGRVASTLTKHNMSAASVTLDWSLAGLALVLVCRISGRLGSVTAAKPVSVEA